MPSHTHIRVHKPTVFISMCGFSVVRTLAFLIKQDTLRMCAGFSHWEITASFFDLILRKVLCSLFFALFWSTWRNKIRNCWPEENENLPAELLLPSTAGFFKIICCNLSVITSTSPDFPILIIESNYTTLPWCFLLHCSGK